MILWIRWSVCSDGHICSVYLCSDTLLNSLLEILSVTQLLAGAGRRLPHLSLMWILTYTVSKIIRQPILKGLLLYCTSAAR